jgi:murein DD-endopeptidase MepM/ murein hydrolase activator NlpD
MALDITAPLGTPIYAAQNATVSVVSIGGWDGGYGNNVWIDNGAGVATHYCHMQAANVSVGQRTVAGQTIIGWVGLTGRTTGAHLHFEVRANGTLVNPMGYLP